MGKRARAQSGWGLDSPGAVIAKGDKLGHVQAVCHVQRKPRLAVPFDLFWLLGSQTLRKSKAD